MPWKAVLGRESLKVEDGEKEGSSCLLPSSVLKGFDLSLKETLLFGDNESIHSRAVLDCDYPHLYASKIGN